jgi:hypothetical protein
MITLNLQREKSGARRKRAVAAAACPLEPLRARRSDACCLRVRRTRSRRPAFSVGRVDFARVAFGRRREATGGAGCAAAGAAGVTAGADAAERAERACSSGVSWSR